MPPRRNYKLRRSNSGKRLLVHKKAIFRPWRKWSRKPIRHTGRLGTLGVRLRRIGNMKFASRR